VKEIWSLLRSRHAVRHRVFDGLVEGSRAIISQQGVLEWLRRRLPQWMPGVTIPQLLDLQEIQEMTRNSAQEWKDMHHQVGLREGLEQGLAQGIERGVEQGSTAEARNILLRQLRRRFGEVPAEIETRLNGASREQLEDWIDRVYEVETVAAVFD
jgi:flagellar biosynthesis/type III secretory pathway protein FliH